MKDDIKRNFEFRYLSRSRHLTPDQELLDKPLNVLFEMGGRIVSQRTINGSDIFDNFMMGSRQFKYEFFEIDFNKEFEKHSIVAIVTREMYPDEGKTPVRDTVDALTNANKNAAYITRIRLGNYNLKDPLAKELSDKLSEIPKDLWENFPALSRLL